MYVRAVIESDGTVRLEAAKRNNDLDSKLVWQPVADESSPSTPWKLEADTPARVELWHVDQHISLWIDGEKIAEKHYKLDWLYQDRLGETPGPTAAFDMHMTSTGSGLPAASLTVEGGEAMIRSVDLDRNRLSVLRKTLLEPSA